MITIEKPPLALAPTPATSIEEVLSRMSEIAASLPENDGVARFNWMYMTTTQSVAAAIKTGEFGDAEYMVRLDVAFANLYFEALALHAQGAVQVPRAWLPLLDARARAGISPLQFALAGMNAHINHDLCIALVRTCEERGTVPLKGSVQHQDYLRIDDVLKREMNDAKAKLLSGTLKKVDGEISSLDDTVAMFDIVEARNLAWDHAEVLWQLRDSPTLWASYLSLLERGVGTLGRGLLIRTAFF